MAAITATTLAIASAVAIAASAAGAAMSLQSNKEAAEANMESQAKQAQLNIAENRRQQEETNRQAQEQKSDVIRKADEDLGTLRAISGGMGASGSSFTRLLMDIAGSEGRDLTRVERNRQSHIDALQADSEAGRLSAASNIQAISASAKNNRNQIYSGLASKVISAGPAIAGGFGGSESYGATGRGLLIRDSKTGMLGGGV